MANPQDVSLEEISWRSPQHVQMMGGFLHSNNILFYFAESPFFDATSNNASLTIQASYNETLRHFLETREAFEGRLKTMQGLEFIVAHDPLQHTAAKMAQKTDNTSAAPKEPSNVWVIRKQIRRKRSGMEEDEVTILATYFVVGDTLFMAPSVSSVIGSRMLSTVTSLTNVLSTASPLPIFSPSYGHTYMPPVPKSLDAAGQQQQQSRQQSKENTPMPDVQQSITSQGSAQNFDNSTGNTGSTIQDTRNLAEAFNLFTHYGDEFMDDSPLVGEPGSFILSKTNEKPTTAAAVAAARQKSGSGSGGTANAAKLPPPPPPAAAASASSGKPGPIKIDSSVKAVGKGTEKSPITPGGGKEKVKRKKSKAGISASPT